MLAILCFCHFLTVLSLFQEYCKTHDEILEHLDVEHNYKQVIRQHRLT